MKRRELSTRPLNYVQALALLALCLGWGLPAQTKAANLVQNPSFELPALPGISSQALPTNWATGWAFWPGPGDFTAPSGKQIGCVIHGIWVPLTQNLGPITAYTTYTLSVKVGQSQYFTFSGYDIKLLVSGTTLVAQDQSVNGPGSGQWVTKTLVYDARPQDVGSNLWISLGSLRNIGPAGQESRVGYDVVSVTAASNLATVTGQVVLSGYQGDGDPHGPVPTAVRVQLRSGGTVRTESALLDNASRFRIGNVIPGTYDIAVKADAWLQALLTNQRVDNGTVVDLGSITLPGGDLDGDNAVSSSDLAIVLATFEAVGQSGLTAAPAAGLTRQASAAAGAIQARNVHYSAAGLDFLITASDGTVLKITDKATGFRIIPGNYYQVEVTGGMNQILVPDNATLRVTIPGAAGERLVRVSSVAPPTVASVYGQVVLSGYQGDGDPHGPVPTAVRVQLRSGGTVRTESAMLDSSNRFRIDNVTPGTYDVAVKADAWLQATWTGRSVGAGVVDLGVIILTGGDADGDNAINSDDLAIVLAGLDGEGTK